MWLGNQAARRAGSRTAETSSQGTATPIAFMDQLLNAA
jgi:hypothetical protein